MMVLAEKDSNQVMTTSAAEYIDHEQEDTRVKLSKHNSHAWRNTSSKKAKTIHHNQAGKCAVFLVKNRSLLPPPAAFTNNNKENIHPDNNILFENNLANEQNIFKKSKTRHDKQGTTRRQRMDEKCERLAKQIVGMIRQNARTLLHPDCLIEHILRMRLNGRFSEPEKLLSIMTIDRLREPTRAELEQTNQYFLCHYLAR